MMQKINFTGIYVPYLFNELNNYICTFKSKGQVDVSKGGIVDCGLITKSCSWNDKVDIIHSLLKEVYLWKLFSLDSIYSYNIKVPVTYTTNIPLVEGNLILRILQPSYYAVPSSLRFFDFFFSAIATRAHVTISPCGHVANVLAIERAQCKVGYTCREGSLCVCSSCRILLNRRSYDYKVLLSLKICSRVYSFTYKVY